MSQPLPLIIHKINNIHPIATTQLGHIYYCADLHDKNISITTDNTLNIYPNYNQV